MAQVFILDSFSRVLAGPRLNNINSAKLATVLRESVSEALNISGITGAELTPSDIEVNTIHCEGGHDGKHNDIRILIFANWFEEREKNLQSVRTPKIAAAVKSALPNDVHGFVYVRLAPAGFTAF